MEIHEYGSYSNWQTTCPYNRPVWTDVMGGNRYYQARLKFTRNWLQDSTASHRDLLIFECYPWHSKSITAPLRPPVEVMEEYVWEPIAELPVQDVFAFGRPWDAVAQALRLPLTAELGSGGTDYGSKVKSRAVRIYSLPSGQRLLVEWHPGFAGPPSPEETKILRRALLGAATGEAAGPITPRPRTGPPNASILVPGEQP
ncbi:hypothetical protein ABTW73_10865 [Micromonospora avicenniae]